MYITNGAVDTYLSSSSIWRLPLFWCAWRLAEWQQPSHRLWKYDM